MKAFLIALAFFFVSFYSWSQKGRTTVGIQFKPIFPVSFLGTGTLANDTGGVHFETTLKSGFSSGMVVRHNFSDLIAFETGINYVKRKYTLRIQDGDFTGDSEFRIIGYEIPAVFMVYAQTGEKTYINGSLGPVLDMFVSDIQTTDYYFNHVAYKNQVFMPAISANVGFEYRTEKSGEFYLGASFQRPFEFIYLSQVLYDGNNKEIIIQNELSGSYLTLDFRYFFPETKVKKID
jgi:hypothetical protein